MTQINAIGDACPIPVVKTKKALAEITSGTLEVLVDNAIAVQNVQRFASSIGCSFDVEEKNNHYIITIEKQDTQQQTDSVCDEVPSGKILVVLSSNVMGSGDDELGGILMKGFVFALTQLDTLPDTILLYNTGAQLSIKGAATLNDLVALEKAGVRILTCGTCLNHFGIADELGVGEVTNMYSIVEEMRDASRILRP